MSVSNQPFFQYRNFKHTYCLHDQGDQVLVKKFDTENQLIDSGIIEHEDSEAGICELAKGPSEERAEKIFRAIARFPIKISIPWIYDKSILDTSGTMGSWGCTKMSTNEKSELIGEDHFGRVVMMRNKTSFGNPFAPFSFDKNHCSLDEVATHKNGKATILLNEEYRKGMLLNQDTVFAALVPVSYHSFRVSITNLLGDSNENTKQIEFNTHLESIQKVSMQLSLDGKILFIASCLYTNNSVIYTCELDKNLDLINIAEAEAQYFESGDSYLLWNCGRISNGSSASLVAHSNLRKDLIDAKCIAPDLWVLQTGEKEICLLDIRNKPHRVAQNTFAEDIQGIETLANCAVIDCGNSVEIIDINSRHEIILWPNERFKACAASSDDVVILTNYNRFLDKKGKQVNTYDNDIKVELFDDGTTIAKASLGLGDSRIFLNNLFSSPQTLRETCVGATKAIRLKNKCIALIMNEQIKLYQPTYQKPSSPLYPFRLVRTFDNAHKIKEMEYGLLITYRKKEDDIFAPQFCHEYYHWSVLLSHKPFSYQSLAKPLHGLVKQYESMTKEKPLNPSEPQQRATNGSVREKLRRAHQELAEGSEKGAHLKLEEALKLDPSSSTYKHLIQFYKKDLNSFTLARIYYAYSLMREGKLNESVQTLEECISDNKNSILQPTLKFYLAEFLFRLGRTDESYQLFSEITNSGQLFYENRQKAKQRCLILRKIGSLDQWRALADEKSWNKISPSLNRSKIRSHVFLRGAQEQEINDANLDDIEAFYKAAISEYPSSFHVGHMYIQFLLRQKRTTEAISRLMQYIPSCESLKQA